MFKNHNRTFGIENEILFIFKLNLGSEKVQLFEAFECTLTTFNEKVFDSKDQMQTKLFWKR